MNRVVAIGTGVTNDGTRTEAGIESSPNPVADPVALRDGVYRCLQLAVDAFGGANELAEALGAARSDTFLRVARKEDSKGALQRAFLDFLGPLLAHKKARAEFVAAFLELIDYEPSKPRSRVTEEIAGKGALDWVRALPPSMKEAARADIARSLGVRVEEIKL